MPASQPASLPHPVEAALFDLDGTLADSMPSIAEALVATLAQFGHATTIEAVYPAFGSNMVEIIQAVVPVDRPQAERIYANYLPRYYDEYMPRTRPLPGADELLADLAAGGPPLGIVTSKIEQGARDLVAHLGWAEHFRIIVGRDTTPELKPSPTPVRHALQVLSVDATRSVFVGDTEEDMLAASGAGVPTVVGIANIREPERLRAAGATHVYEDLAAARELLLAALRPEPA